MEPHASNASLIVNHAHHLTIVLCVLMDIIIIMVHVMRILILFGGRLVFIIRRIYINFVGLDANSVHRILYVLLAHLDFFLINRAVYNALKIVKFATPLSIILPIHRLLSVSVATPAMPF